MLCLDLLLVAALVLPLFTMSSLAVITVCNDTRSIAIGEELRTNFGVAVKTSSETGSCNIYCLEPAFKNLHRYVAAANESCYRTKNKNKNGLEFYKLMKFSLNGNSFKDFIANGGIQCVTATTSKLEKCKATKSKDTFNRLWKMTSPYIQESQCKKAKDLKLCTLNAIQEAGVYTCNPSVMVFIGSLFDHMLERCAALVPPSVPVVPGKPIPKKSKPDITNTVLLAILLTLAVLMIAYVLIFDFALPNGRCKALSEQIAMKNRRRSLVHNEVGCEQ